MPAIHAALKVPQYSAELQTHHAAEQSAQRTAVDTAERTALGQSQLSAHWSSLRAAHSAAVGTPLCPAEFKADHTTERPTSPVPLFTSFFGSECTAEQSALTAAQRCPQCTTKCTA